LKSGQKTEQADNKPNQWVFDDVTINFDTKELKINGETIPLTRTEFEIITLLASNPSRVFEREDMIDRIWKDSPYVTERTIDVHIRRLRKKLGDRASLISSRTGYGYRFNITEQ
jgi:DNA-binding response OmpR family regulator